MFGCLALLNTSRCTVLGREQPEIVDGGGGRGPSRASSRTLTGEAKPHVLLQLWVAERKHLGDVCAKALHAGIARRQIEVMEDMARQVVGVMTDLARRLGLDPTAPEVRTAGSAALRVIAGGASESS